MGRVRIDYLAGAIDGEGCVTFTQRAQAPWAYTPNVYVVNTNRAWLKKLKQNFGGTLVPHGRHSPRHKFLYSLRWSGPAAQRLLRRVLPFLLMKQKQARLVLAHKPDGQHWGRKGMPAWKRRQRIAALKKIRQLNKRGLETESRKAKSNTQGINNGKYQCR